MNVGLWHLLTEFWDTTTRLSAVCSFWICLNAASTRLMGSEEYPIGPISAWP